MLAWGFFDFLDTKGPVHLEVLLASATNGSWFLVQVDARIVEDPHAVMLYGAMTLIAIMVILLPGQKETPFSPGERPSRGFQLALV